MLYRTMGWLDANLVHAVRSARGQGTVEYVGLLMLLATVLTGVIAVAGGLKGGGIAQEVVKKLKETIDQLKPASGR